MNKLKLLSLSALATMCLLSFTTAPLAPKPVSYAMVTSAAPKAVWVKDNYDFGEIPQGKPVSVDFTFTNNGDAALLIADVVTSCGCTASDYPKEPIAPGKTSTIKVTYNANAMGAFSKTITVKSNEEAAKILTIKGTVK